MRANSQEAFSSSDGGWIYYNQAATFDVFRCALSGGALSAPQTSYHVPNAIAWALGATHVYLGTRHGEEPTRIVSMELVSGKQQEIYRFPPEIRAFNITQTSLSVRAMSALSTISTESAWNRTS